MKLKEIKGFDDIKVKFTVSYDAVDGRKYTVENVEAKHEYDATSIIASEVNSSRNYGFNFKAEFSGF